MRRSYAVVLLLGLSLLTVALPASADFHPDCTGVATGYANTHLEASADGAEVTYGGTVNCPGATVTIASVQLVDTAEDRVLATTTLEACQAELASPCSVSDTVPAPDEGRYTVRMTFDTENFEDVPRSQQWEWLGVGQPVLTCANAGAFPVQGGDC